MNSTRVKKWGSEVECLAEVVLIKQIIITIDKEEDNTNLHSLKILTPIELSLLVPNHPVSLFRANSQHFKDSQLMDFRANPFKLHQPRSLLHKNRKKYVKGEPSSTKEEINRGFELELSSNWFGLEILFSLNLLVRF
jgi:hypothetical protein